MLTVDYLIDSAHWEGRSALGSAFHLQNLSACVQQPTSNATGDDNCSPRFTSDPARVPSQMLTALRLFNMPASTCSRFPAELEGTFNHFTLSGRLIADLNLIQIAWYSDDDGLVLAAVMTSQSR